MEVGAVHSDGYRKRKLENGMHELPYQHREVKIEEDINSFVEHKLGKLCRFWFICNKKWEPYPDAISAAIRISFTAHQKRVQFSISDQLCVIDFPHMMQLNIKTGYIRSIAWVDCSGKFVRPAKCVEGLSRHWRSLLRNKTQEASSAVISEISASPQQSYSFHSKANSFQESGLLVSLELPNSVSLVESKDQDYFLIREKFITGLGSFADTTSVYGIHRCLYEGKSAQERLETFERQGPAVKSLRGDANICYAWHGASKERIVGIVSQGFDQSRRQSNGSVYDPGIYLSPEGNVFLSAMYSDADEQGIQYILLCKMIKGKMEQLPKGGEKFSPSTEDYDTGVDDLRQPSQYVVQSTKTNTHVLPIFIITFKLSTCWQSLLLAMQRASDSSVPCCLSCKQPPSTTRHSAMDLRKASHLEAQGDACVQPTASRAEPYSSGIPFQHLLSKLKQTVDPCGSLALQKLHAEFEAGRLPRKILVNMIRAVAGDALLLECLSGGRMNLNGEFVAEYSTGD